LPAGTSAGSYTIDATYNPGSNFATSGNSNTLTVGQRATTTTAANANSTYSEQAVNVTLSATVSATDSSVNAGTVTFQVKDGLTNVGSAVTSDPVPSGPARRTSALPPATTAASNYTVDANNPPGKNHATSDNTNTLTVGQRATTTTAANANS